jgi:hypothetical protein
MENKSFTNYLLLLIFLVITAGTSILYIEIHHANQLQRSKFSFELNESHLKNSIDTAIGNDIAYNKPILIKNHGRWSDENLNDYLGFFEILSDYVDAGSLDYRDVVDFYSDDVLIAYHNKEVQKYIADARKDGGSNEYFIKFEKLANDFEKINRENKN